ARGVRGACPVGAETPPRRQALARDRRVTVVVDSVEAARALPGVGALVEVDVGVGRCGVTTPEQAIAVARACSEFRGLFYWPSWLDEAGFPPAPARVDEHIAAGPAAGLAGETGSRRSPPRAGDTPPPPPTPEIRP